ncbi:hypothetical protein AKJ64_03475 [candidate division MSBL1 archaeon SCGC-AAA259E17]|uniref:Uncharacterized protein n=1 Tax=candidate division MSBL1 archaeon SCGC-AAA259E17 TaxID=1698263 RepID=A0A133UDQ2_9EURY|nr:hypothetical protein AKJ64_03475 [candidate division MSBL1 archaeon SCGC-AAA259E17]
MKLFHTIKDFPSSARDLITSIRTGHQSAPRVIIIFGKAVMRAFVKQFKDNFKEGGTPNPQESYSEI